MSYGGKRRTYAAAANADDHSFNNDSDSSPSQFRQHQRVQQQQQQQQHFQSLHSPPMHPNSSSLHQFSSRALPRSLPSPKVNYYDSFTPNKTNSVHHNSPQNAAYAQAAQAAQRWQQDSYGMSSQQHDPRDQQGGYPNSGSNRRGGENYPSPSFHSQHSSPAHNSSLPPTHMGLSLRRSPSASPPTTNYNRESKSIAAKGWNALAETNVWKIPTSREAGGFNNGYQFQEIREHNTDDELDQKWGRSPREFKSGSKKKGSKKVFPMEKGDKDSEELRLWNQQQRLIDVHNRNYSLIKYGGSTVVLALLALVCYLLFARDGGISIPHGKDSVQLHVSISSADPAAATEQPAVGGLKGISEREIEEARNTMRLLTEREAARQRAELLELDESALDVAPPVLTAPGANATASELAKMNLVELATVIIKPPTPEALEYEKLVNTGSPTSKPVLPSHASATEDVNLDESPEVLRQVAEHARSASDSSIPEEEAALMDRTLGINGHPTIFKKFHHHARDGHHHEEGAEHKEEDHKPREEEEDEDQPFSDALLRVPPLPAASQANHLVIEQLIHTHVPDGHDSPRKHAHKDHPSLPKTATGSSPITMPKPDKEFLRWIKEAEDEEKRIKDLHSQPRQPEQHGYPKPKVAAEEAPATQTPAAPATEAPAAPEVSETPVAATTPESKQPAATPAEMPSETPAPANAPVNAETDELLSELLEAKRPSSVMHATEREAELSGRKHHLKGPVVRGANAEAAQVAETVDMQLSSSKAATPPKTPEPAAKDDKSAAGAPAPTQPAAASPASGAPAAPTAASEAPAAATPAAATSADAATAPKKKPAPSSSVFSGDNRKESEKKWKKTKGASLGDLIPWTLPTEAQVAATLAGSNQDGSKGSSSYLFDDDIHFFVMTSLKNQALARKVKNLYSPLIKRLTFISSHRDAGLNATTLLDPHDDWSVTNKKDQPWELYELFNLLLDPKRSPEGEKPAKFYFVMHDTTFPLLDQIQWRLNKYREAYGGLYPNFIGGRKSGQAFEKTFWTEQQEAGKKMFTGKKLFVVPSYIYGFDRHFLESVRDFTVGDSCPVLHTEGLALAGLIECAGGNLELTEYDFLMQTRSNHREKRIDKDLAPLRLWRVFDAYHGCNTPGMLQEAFDSYYGKLKAPSLIPVATPTPAAAGAAQEQKAA